MGNDGRVQSIVLQEFRLHAADDDGTVARMVASSSAGRELAVPLLTSIDDSRDVATIRGLRAPEPTPPEREERDALAPFVSSWHEPRQYVPRIAESSQSPPGHYRLAVTESGINNAEAHPHPLGASKDAPMGGASSTAIGLIWIGLPVGTHAGLLILLGLPQGGDGGPPEAADWPLPLSRSLGVRIYEGAS